MYTNIVVPLTFRELDIALVVTEIEFHPEVRQNFSHEGEAEFIQVIAGYAIEQDTGDAVDWRDAYDANCNYVDKFISSELKK